MLSSGSQHLRLKALICNFFYIKNHFDGALTCSKANGFAAAATASPDHLLLLYITSYITNSSWKPQENRVLFSNTVSDIMAEEADLNIVPAKKTSFLNPDNLW